MAPRNRSSLERPLDVLQAAHRKDQADLPRLLDLGEAVRGATALIHELQKERGLSSGYVASEGSLFSQPLRLQTSRAQEAWRTAFEAWTALPAPFLTPVTQAALAKVLEDVEPLRTLRADVRGRSLTPTATVTQFTALIDHWIGVVALASGTTSDAPLTLALLSLFHWVRAKEFSGQERAWGSMVCAQRGFEPWQRERLLAVDEQRKEALVQFQKHANADQTRRWAGVEDSQDYRQMELLRKALHGADAPGTDEFPGVEDWFRTSTAVIDQYRVVELSLLDGVESVVATILADARSLWEASQIQPSPRESEILRTLGKAHQSLLDLARNPEQDEALEAELRRWRKNLRRIEPLAALLSNLEQRARLLVLDTRIEAMDRDTLEREAQTFQRMIADASSETRELIGILTHSADRVLQALEERRNPPVSPEE